MPDTTIAMVPLTAYGHLNPTLPIARELVTRGYDVTYYLPASFAGAVERTGAAVATLDEGFVLPNLWADGGVRPDAERVFGEFMQFTTDATPDLVERVGADGADAVLYDPLCGWGRTVAAETGLPAIGFHPTFAMSADLPGTTALRDRIIADSAWMAEAIPEGSDGEGADPPDPIDFVAADEPLNLVALPPSFQPDAQSFDDRFAFVGPLVRETDYQYRENLPREALAGAERAAYVSLGSILDGGADLLGTCAEAFSDDADGAWTVVVNDDSPDADTPAHLVVRDGLPQLGVLERVDVFVTHGGMNSVMEALWHGVPVVVVPQMNDQALVAEQVERLGLGVVLDAAPTPAALSEAVAEATRPAVVEAVEAYQSQVRSSGGPERAVDAVEAYLDGN